MERLREQRDASDPVVVEAAKLLGELAPAEDEPGRKERVRRSLAARLGGRRWRAPAWVLVPAAGLIGLAAAAAERVWNPPAAEVPVAERPISRAKPDHNAPAPAPVEVADPKPELKPKQAPTRMPAEAPAPELEPLDPKPEPKAKLRPKPTHAAAEVEVTSPPVPARDDETLLLVEAVRTLRRENRPEAASALLEEYLRRHPYGALREEGLALAVEAASASKNEIRAAELAREYIARYPAGRFRAQADAAISNH
jgi:outer membrane biosynthesis protein TonB